MKKNVPNLLPDSFIPNDIKNRVFSSECFFSKIYKRSKQDELRELKIHLENAKDSGLIIDGGAQSVNILSKLNTHSITIFAGKNELYFFKLYIDETKQETICYILIERKIRTQEDISELSLKLGIKKTPYS